MAWVRAAVTWQDLDRFSVFTASLGQGLFYSWLPLCGSCVSWSLGFSCENSSAVLVFWAAEDLGLKHVSCPTVSSLRALVLYLLSTNWERPCPDVGHKCLAAWTAGCSSRTPAGTDLVAVPLGESGWETLEPFFRGCSDLFCRKQVPKLRLWPGSGKISAMRMGPQLCGAKCQWNLIFQGCFQDFSESTFVWVSVTASPLSRACHYFMRAPSGLCGIFHVSLSLLLGSRWCPKVPGLFESGYFYFLVSVVRLPCLQASHHHTAL